MGNSVTNKKIWSSNWEVMELSIGCVGTMQRGLLVIAHTVAGGCGWRARGWRSLLHSRIHYHKKTSCERNERSAAVVTVYIKADRNVLVPVCHMWPLAYPVRNLLCFTNTCNSAQSSLSHIRPGKLYSFFFSSSTSSLPFLSICPPFDTSVSFVLRLFTHPLLSSFISLFTNLKEQDESRSFLLLFIEKLSLSPRQTVSRGLTKNYEEAETDTQQNTQINNELNKHGQI